MSDHTVIRAIAYADGSEVPFANLFLASADHDAERHSWTPDLDLALHFATAADAWEFWRKQSRVRTHRLDGKPNRPLTAISVELVPVHDGQQVIP